MRRVAKFRRKCALVTTFGIAPGQFRPALSETEEEIAITVSDRCPDPDDTTSNDTISSVLGSITFCKSERRVTITNCGSTLDPREVELGYSTRLGAHGEGLPLAALVLVRDGFHLCVTSGRHHWKFLLLDDQELGYELCTVQDDGSPDDEGESDGESDGEFDGNQDGPDDTVPPGKVSIVIDRNAETTDDWTFLDEFRRWMGSTIDLNRPATQVQTPHGDLILDPTFSNRRYFRGSALAAPSSARRRLVYGYNFVDGAWDRDRRHLHGAPSEAQQIARIWDAAIGQRSDLLFQYLDLFQHCSWSADVSRAETTVSPALVAKMWAVLLDRAGSCGLFYLRGHHMDTVGARPLWICTR